MAKNDTPRWIRTSCGYAGRNGFITKAGIGTNCFAQPYDSVLSRYFPMISQAKEFLDAGDFSDLSPEPQTSDEIDQVAGPENTD